MATSWPFAVLLLMIFSTKQVLGYYCDSDRCGVDEYCCGVNICCTSYAVWQMWYFWCGIVFFIILLSACAGFCRYRYYQTAIIIQGSSPYSRLDNSAATFYPSQNGNQCTDYPGMAYPSPMPPKYMPNYPPPAYAQKHSPDKDREFSR